MRIDVTNAEIIHGFESFIKVTETMRKVLGKQLDFSQSVISLGIIEGYYGKPWSWDQRREMIAALSEIGYRYFVYAPKADYFLRRNWRDEFPKELESGLSRTAAICRERGVQFGVGSRGSGSARYSL